MLLTLSQFNSESESMCNAFIINLLLQGTSL